MGAVPNDDNDASSGEEDWGAQDQFSGSAEGPKRAAVPPNEAKATCG